jgi:hypothetical protein
MGQVLPTKGTIKLQIPIDLGGGISTLIFVTHGKIHKVNLRDDLLAEPGVLYILVRGYLDFARLYKIHRSGASFIILAKSNFRFRRLYLLPESRQRYQYIIGPRSAIVR